MTDQPKQPIQGPKQPLVGPGGIPLEPPPSLLSEVFPQAKKIQIEVEFHDASGVRVQRRCRELAPDSRAVFDMKCPLDTTPLDLTSVLEKMISQRLKDRSEELKCAGSRADNKHNVTFRIDIEYMTKKR